MRALSIYAAPSGLHRILSRMHEQTVFQPEDIIPTDEQLRIQLSRDPFVMVHANAGAAKTTTLALRLAQALVRGAPHDALLALTYTEPARQALEESLRKIGVPWALRSKLKVLTFEAFSRSVMRRLEGADVPCHDSAEELKPFLMTAIHRVLDNPQERYPDELMIPGSGDAVIEQYLDDFVYLKGTLLLAVEAEDRPITPALAAELGRDYASLKVFLAYERERRGGHPDRPRFRAEGDATYDLARHLMSAEASLQDEGALPQNLRLLVVDEMHDMNRAMFTVLQQLLSCNRRCNFVGVGDSDQVIHARAGADARFMGETFKHEIGDVRSYPLSASFRFGPALAKPAGLVARKKYASLAERQTTVKVHACSGTAESDAAIAAAALAHARLRPRQPMSQFAVLLRHPYQSIGIENRLLAADVAYKTAGFASYLIRPEVLLVRGLLAYAADDFSAIQSDQTRRGVLQAMLLFGGASIQAHDPYRAAGKPRDQATLEEDAQKAIAENPRLLQAFFENQVLRTGTPRACARMTAAVEAARMHTGPDTLRRVIEALQPHELAAQALVRAARVREVVGNMAGLLSSARDHQTAHDYFMALNDFELRQEGLKSQQSIVLSSIEAAKGLEFEHVLLPNINAREFAVSGDSADDRNLFYVAITRAKSMLSIYHDASRPSRYLADAGLLASQASSLA